MNIFTKSFAQPLTADQRSEMITQFVQEIYNLPEALRDQMMTQLTQACEKAAE